MAKLHVVKKLRNERDILEVNEAELASASGTDNCVKLTGNQTVAGKKTFSGEVAISGIKLSVTAPQISLNGQQSSNNIVKVIGINRLNEVYKADIPPYITQFKTSQYQCGENTEVEPAVKYGRVVFSVTSAELERVLASKFIIFTMNNSFVMTPLAQSGATRACQSFVYDSDGNSAVARLSITPDSEAPSLIVEFDTSFASLTYNSGITPYAMLILVE